MKTIAITARIPEATFRQIPEYAKSKNSFIVEAIREKIARDKQSMIEESLLSLVEGPEDISFAMAAQRRAMRIAD